MVARVRLSPIVSDVVYHKASKRELFIKGRQKDQQSLFSATLIYGLKDSLLLFDADPATVFIGTAATTEISRIENYGQALCSLVWRRESRFECSLVKERSSG